MRSRMLAALLAHCLFILASTAIAADPAEEVRKAEIAFAKAFADRESGRFFSFVADDATFMNRGEILRGRKAVVRGWTRYFNTPTAPFSWRPEHVSANAAGNLGLSAGPVFDPDGRQVGSYVSTWQKQRNGSWKILFDAPGAGPGD